MYVIVGPKCPTQLLIVTGMRSSFSVDWLEYLRDAVAADNPGLSLPKPIRGLIGQCEIPQIARVALSNGKRCFHCHYRLINIIGNRFAATYLIKEIPVLLSYPVEIRSILIFGRRVTFQIDVLENGFALIGHNLQCFVPRHIRRHGEFSGSRYILCVSCIAFARVAGATVEDQRAGDSGFKCE